jgi:hypothetical protein
MSNNIGEHYGYGRDWILTEMSVMNCIAAEEGITLEELVNNPKLKNEVLERAMRVTTKPGRNHSIQPDDILNIMNSLKDHPNYLIPKSI